MTGIVFTAPRLLWLLAGPAALLLVWAWLAMRRRIDVRRLAHRQLVPGRERVRRLGELTLWLAVLVATTALLLAAAEPVARTALPRRAGLDVVVMQDASASMRVTDVARASSD